MPAPDESPDDRPATGGEIAVPATGSEVAVAATGSEVTVPAALPGSDPVLVRPYVSHLRPPALLDVPDAATAEMPATLEPEPPVAGQHRTGRRRSRPLWIAVALFVLVGAVIGAGWLALRPPTDSATGPDLGPPLPAFPLPTDTPSTSPTTTRPSATHPSTAPKPTRTGTTPTATSPAASTSPTAPAAPIPLNVPPHTATITSIPGTCVDNNSNWSVEGNPIQLWDCNNTKAQQWAYGTDATLRVLNMCMRPAGGTPVSGTVVQLRACATAYQGWLFRGDGSLFNPASGLCLADPGAPIDGRRQLIVATCANGASQRWTFG